MASQIISLDKFNTLKEQLQKVYFHLRGVYLPRTENRENQSYKDLERMSALTTGQGLTPATVQDFLWKHDLVTSSPKMHTIHQIETFIAISSFNWPLLNIRNESLEIDKTVMSFANSMSKHIKNWEFEIADSLYIKAINLTNEKYDEFSISILNLSYAIILKYRDKKYKEAIAILQDCLIVFLKYNSISHVAQCYQEIIKLKSRNNEATTIVVEDLLNHAISNNDVFSIAFAQYYLARQEYNNGNFPKCELFLKKSLTNTKRALLSDNIDQKIKGELLIFSIYSLLATYNIVLGNCRDARSYCIKALSLGEKYLEKKEFCGNNYRRMAEIEILEGNLKTNKWKEYLKKAIEIFKEVGNYDQVRHCLNLIAWYEGTNVRIFNHSHEFINVSDYENAIKRFDLLDQNNLDDWKIIDIITEVSLRAKYHGFICKNKNYDKKREELFLCGIRNLESLYLRNDKSEDKRICLSALDAIAELQVQLGESLQAIGTYESILKDINHDILKMSRVSIILGKLYLDINDVDEGINQWRNTISYLKGTSFQDLKFRAYCNLGITFLNVKKDHEATQAYFSKAKLLNTEYSLGYNEYLDNLEDNLSYPLNDKANQYLL